MTTATQSVAHAQVTYAAGNLQFTNVNIAADAHDTTILGEIGHSGVHIAFQGFATTSSITPLVLHGQHGVAFVQPSSAADPLFKLTLTADPGFQIMGIDFALDAHGDTDGTVTFQSFSPTNTLLTPTGGLDTFAFGATGENKYHAITAGGAGIRTFVITSTINIADIKAVSAQVQSVSAPEPSSALLMTGGLSAFLVVRKRRSRKQAPLS